MRVAQAGLQVLPLGQIDQILFFYRRIRARHVYSMACKPLLQLVHLQCGTWGGRAQREGKSERAEHVQAVLLEAAFASLTDMCSKSGAPPAYGMAPRQLSKT